MTQSVLAQYTIRSKQAYIFRGNRLMEAIGGSAIISSIYDSLFDCISAAGFRFDRPVSPEPFDFKKTKDLFAAGKLDVVELFVGGGNDTLLFRNADVVRSVNERFSYKLLTEFPGLIPMYVGTPAGDDFKADYSSLMELSFRQKNTMHASGTGLALPFSMVDRVTFQPLCSTVTVKDKTGKEEKIRLSKEAAVKWDAAQKDGKTSGIRQFDDMVTANGSESLLAIVHADGNNMGIKIQNALAEQTDYSACVTMMRKLTKDVSNAFAQGKNAVDQLVSKYADSAVPSAMRWVIDDGDDVTFICNARYAKLYTETFLKSLREYRSSLGEPLKYSACAGICIFHSHYPVARAYKIAEQACDNAKVPVHKTREESAWMDVQYIHGGINGSLEDIRTIQRTASCMLRPWQAAAYGEKEDVSNVSRLDRLAAVFGKANIARSNVKSLGIAAETSMEAWELEWKRICYKNKSLNAQCLELYEDKQALLRATYDLAEFYDIWFRLNSGETEAKKNG